MPVLPPSQQPLAHETESQTHCWFTQRLPAPHAAPEPQAQLPPVHRSAIAALQLVQDPPPVPHSCSVGGCVQTPLWQQPVGQEVASQTHTPMSQRCPAAHCALPPHLHCPPALQVSARLGSHEPQVEPGGAHWVALSVTQLLELLQQPVVHEVESQTH